MKIKPFHFKQFYVFDDKSTMKVGTDAIILGAWSDTRNADNILDIGTGCGIIALMLAQKSSAQITAIDIDKESIKQAKMNFRNSPWNDRLNTKQISMQEFVRSTNQKFDLIVSNPPYFSQSLKPENIKRKVARHYDTLSFSGICSDTKTILNHEGSFYIVLPFQEKNGFTDIANDHDLHLSKEFRFIPVRGKTAKLVVLCFSHKNTETIIEDDIIIREADENHTREFIDATNEYYIFSQDEVRRKLSEDY